MQKDKY